MLIAPRSHFASGIHEKFCCPTTFSEGLAGSIDCPGVIHSGSEMDIQKPFRHEKLVRSQPSVMHPSALEKVKASDTKKLNFD